MRIARRHIPPGIGHRLFLAASIAGALAAAPAAAHAAPPEPTGPHPRIWLDAGTLTSMRDLATDNTSAVARAIKRCAAITADPAGNADSGYQGFSFAENMSACALAWQITGDQTDAATALVYFQALLDDYKKVGDGGGGDGVVQHDDGYPMRAFGAYAALGYDWLHDAPGMTDALLAHARERFAAWTSWYATSGYLPHTPDANYEAGYLFASTLIAIAQGGEAGTAGTALWNHVADDLWGQDVVPAFGAGGVLDGGGWAEGWQYGPLSVLEYALAARALDEQGVDTSALAGWPRALVLRYVHAVTPPGDGMFVGGDFDSSMIYTQPPRRPLLAALLAPESGAAPPALGWAQAALDAIATPDEFAALDALAEARQVAAVPFPHKQQPTYYVVPGTQTMYARSGWSASAIWSAFQCAPKRVPDHQHVDAGNIVLSRGGDDVIIDPSPYGSLSTLTSNAPAVRADSLPSAYQPSQGVWGKKVGLVWARQTQTGVAAARCSYADQFRGSSTPSDIASALRDVVLVPSAGSADLIVLDRVQSGAASRSLQLRFRTPAKLSLSGAVARGTVGKSALSITRVFGGGDPSVRAMPSGTDCSSGDRGKCDVSRIAGDEFRVEVPGPSAWALDAVEVAPRGTPPPRTQALQGTGYRGALIQGYGRPVVVVSADTLTPAPGQRFTYRAPALDGAVHVVLDAPAGAGGRADVTAQRDGSDCAVTVTARDGTDGGFASKPVVVGVSADCQVSEQAPWNGPSPPPPGGGGSLFGGCAVGGDAGAAGGAAGGQAAGAVAVALLALAAARLRRRPGRP